MRVLVMAAVLAGLLSAAGATLELPGHPFGVAISLDGNWLFTTLAGAGEKPSGLAIVRRDGGRMELSRFVPLEGLPTGIVLMPDGKQLLVAAREQVYLLDVAALISGAGDPIAATFHDGENPGSIYVNVTRDGRFAFVSEERAAAITVIDLEKRSEVGKIPVGRAPIALTFSRDGKLLYTTSQAAVKEWGWPDVCRPEGANPPAGAPNHPQGAVVVIDVAVATVEPAKAVVSRVPAACNPVRLAMQEDGKRIFVTARNSDALLAFDTRKLVTRPEKARVAIVTVGTAPVPVIALDSGSRVVVGNSNRFGTAKEKTPSLTVLDGRKLKPIGTLEGGEFPRELRLSPDGRTLYLTNFNSNTLQMFAVNGGLIQ